MNNTLSASACIKFGWETFKKRPGVFIGVIILLFIVSSISSTITGAIGESGNGLIGLLGFILSVAITIYIEMILTSFFLKTHESPESISWKDVTTSLPFWKYLGAKILASIIIIAGFILLIVPGIILALMFFAVQYLVIDKKLDPVAALKESKRITAGHKWDLFVLFIVVVLLNILGALALFIGLLVTIPVTVLAMVHAYRTLEHKANEVAPAGAPITV